MKKKTLVSILAMTSVSMGAYADANVEQNIGMTEADWTGAPEIGEDKIIVSPNGATITQKISLLPGSYTFTAATKVNAKLQISGASVTGWDATTGSFKVTGDQASEATITIMAVEAGKEFQVGGFGLILDFDFAAANTSLTSTYAKMLNKITNGENGVVKAQAEALRTKYTKEILGLINEVKDNQENSYEKYGEYQLYKGWANSTLNAAIAKANDNVDNNFLPYQKAMEVHAAQVDAFVESKKGLEGDGTWIDLKKTYVKNQTSENVTGIQGKLDTYKKGADDAYQQGNVGATYTDAYNTTFVNTINGLLKTFESAIATAAANDDAYRALKAELESLRKQYNEASTAITTAMLDDVYQNLREQANKALIEQALNFIVDYEKRLGTEASHQGASALAKENIDNGTTDGVTVLQQVANNIAKLKADYTAQVAGLEEAYEVANDKKTVVSGEFATLKGMLEKAGVSTNFATEVTEIDGLIAALGKAIENDYKAYEITLGKYDGQISDIDEKILALKNKAFGSKDGVSGADNYAAYETALGYIENTLEKALKEKGDEVAKLLSVDKLYAPKDYLQPVLDEYSVDVEKYEQDLIKALTDGSGAQAWYGSNRGKMESTWDQIDAYSIAAKNCLTFYNGIYYALNGTDDQAIDGYTEAIAALREVVGSNTDVWFNQGADKAVTYATKIAELEAISGRVVDLKDEALRLNDAVAHANKMEDAYRATQTADAQNLVQNAETWKAQFAADKEYYDQKIVGDVVGTLLNQASATVTAQQKTMSTHNTSLTTLESNLMKDGYDQTFVTTVTGLRAEYSAIVKAQGDLQDDINDVRAVTNPGSEEMALMNTVNASLGELSGRITELARGIKYANTTVSTNETAKETADTETTRIDAYLNGGKDGETNLASLINVYGQTGTDPDTLAYYTQLSLDLNEKLTQLNKDITAEYRSYLLDEVWNNGKKDVVALKTQAANLLQKVKDARAAAEASKKNWVAYQNVVKYYGTGAGNLDIDGKLAQAFTDLNNAGIEVLPYYTNLINVTYTNQFAKLQTEIADSYKKFESVKTESGYKGELKDLADLITSVVSKAKANDETYTAQISKYDKYVKEYERVYKRIAETDQTSAAVGYLNRLNEEKAKLDSYLQDIKDAYNNGESVGQNTTLLDNLNACYNAIGTIERDQADGLNGAIVADNNTRYAAFEKAADQVRTDYTAALDTITKYAQLKTLDPTIFTTPDLMARISAQVDEANKTINGTLSNLVNLENKAENEKTTANTTYVLYDEFENNRKTAEGYSKAIKGAVDLMIENVNDWVKEDFRAQYNAKNTEYELCMRSISGFRKEAKENDILKEVNAWLVAAQENLDVNDRDLALNVTAHLANFSKISEQLALGTIKAAKIEGKEMIADREDEYEDRLEKIQGFSYISEAIKDEVVGAYEALESDLSDIRSEYEKVTDAVQFTYVTETLKFALEAFDVTEEQTYQAAKDASEAEEANAAAYKKQTDAIVKMREGLASAEAYISKYVIVYEIGVTETEIDQLEANVEAWKKAGTSVANANDTRFTDYKNLIDGAKAAANRIEQIRLTSEIAALYADQNKAADAVKDDSEKQQLEVAEFIETIQALDTRYQDAIEVTGEIGKLTDLNEKQNKYLEFEGLVADIRAQLYEFYADEATIYNELSQGISTVLTNAEGLLTDRHEAVVAEYETVQEGLVADIQALNAQLEEYNTNKQILLAQPKIEELTAKLEADYESLKADVDAMDLKYNTNDSKYAELSRYIEEELLGKLNELKEEKFKYAKPAQSSLRIIEILIGDEQRKINELHAQVKLTESSTVSGAQSILDRIHNLYVNTTHSDKAEIIRREIDADYDVLKNRIITSITEEDGITYLLTSEDYNTLKTEQLRIDGMITDLKDFNNDSQDGKIDKDIDGNDVPQGTSIDYLTEAVDQIDARVETLKTDLENLWGDLSEKVYVRGDINCDSLIQVNDYTTLLDYAIGKRELPANDTKLFRTLDVNQDKQVNVGDLTQLTNFILTGNYTPALMSQIKARFSETVNDAIALGMESQEGIQRIAVRLSNASAYTAYQMDVKLPAGVSVMGTSLGDAAADHEVYTNTLADGTCRVIVTSMQNSTFADSDDALIYLEVSGKAAAQVTVTEAMAADATGKVYNVRGIGGGETTGIDGVTADQSMKAKIYSVGGQLMDKVTRGINIIRNADGTTKKVLKK